jgi:hypothetical protein
VRETSIIFSFESLNLTILELIDGHNLPLLQGIDVTKGFHAGPRLHVRTMGSKGSNKAGIRPSALIMHPES